MKVVEKLRPEYILIDYVRSVFLFDQKSWVAMKKTADATNYPLIDKFIPPDCDDVLQKYKQERDRFMRNYRVEQRSV